MMLIARVLLLICLVIYCAEHSKAWFLSSGGGSSTTHHYDITPAGLRKLYNARVTKAERWMRPLASSGGVNPTIARALNLKHSGVVVTVDSGQRFLVHKGDEYGRSSQTVVVNASVMSSVWWRTESKTVRHSRVADYVRVGGATYSLWRDNCHHASKRMMNLN